MFCFGLMFWSMRISPCSLVMGSAKFWIKLFAFEPGAAAFGNGNRYRRALVDNGAIRETGICLLGKGKPVVGSFGVPARPDKSPLRMATDGTLWTSTDSFGSRNPSYAIKKNVLSRPL